MSEVREYWPAVKGGRPCKRFRFGDYRALVLTEVESLGSVEYLYVMPVFRIPESELCLCVAAEENQMHGRKLPGDATFDPGGSHFLGLFPGQGHLNFGSSDDWADVDRFAAKALELARGHLKIDDATVEEEPRRPWWRFW